MFQGPSLTRWDHMWVWFQAGDFQVCQAYGKRCFPDKPGRPKTRGEDQPVSDEASPRAPTPLPYTAQRAQEDGQDDRGRKVREQWGRMDVHRDPERHRGTGPESGQSPKGALKRMKAIPEGNATSIFCGRIPVRMIFRLPPIGPEPRFDEDPTLL